MKRKNNLYQLINNYDCILDMYKEIYINTKNKRKVSHFDDYLSINICNIKRIIESKNYIPGKYNIFLIREPKYRIIMSQNIKDKIINHLVAYYFLYNIFDKRLENENCATRINKGTHYALNMFKKKYNYYKNRYDNFYILKVDISKYFYNIDHNIVKEIIKNKIKDKDVIKIIESIIDSTDKNYVNEDIENLKRSEIKHLKTLNIINKNQKIKEVSNLPIYKKGKGFPIGNMSSQIIATFYLDELDKYIKYELNVSHIRYMDDIILMHYDKEYLKKCLKSVEIILKKYKLNLNKKTKIYNSNEEVEFLGFRFCIIHGRTIMKLTNKTKKRFKRKIKYLIKKYKEGVISFDEYRCVRDSYIGHLSHGNCNKIMYNIINI